MCTLTVVPLPGRRTRLAVNRDEQRTRPAGLPPTVRTFGQRRAALPTDPVSGGTWVGVNDARLALALLNVTTSSLPIAMGGLHSRGAIIPALLGCDSPASALAAFEQSFDCRAFAPFRLVLVGQGIVAKVRWDGRATMVVSQLLGGIPLLATSSGLGDHLVEEPRRELFDELFAGPPAGWAEAQAAFHVHRWPDRGHLSVNMDRPDARTVSVTVIDLTEDEATLTYHPDAPGRPAEQTVCRLPLSPCGVP